MYYATIANIYFDRPRIFLVKSRQFLEARLVVAVQWTNIRETNEQESRKVSRERGGEVADIRCGMVGGRGEERWWSDKIGETSVLVPGVL